MAAAKFCKGCGVLFNPSQRRDAPTKAYSWNQQLMSCTQVKLMAPDPHVHPKCFGWLDLQVVWLPLQGSLQDYVAV